MWPSNGQNQRFLPIKDDGIFVQCEQKIRLIALFLLSPKLSLDFLLYLVYKLAFFHFGWKENQQSFSPSLLMSSSSWVKWNFCWFKMENRPKWQDFNCIHMIWKPSNCFIVVMVFWTYEKIRLRKFPSKFAHDCRKAQLHFWIYLVKAVLCQGCFHKFYCTKIHQLRSRLFLINNSVWKFKVDKLCSVSKESVWFQVLQLHHYMKKIVIVFLTK